MPRLSVEQVLAWADAYKSRTGQWPIVSSGLIDESPNDTWAAVNSALTSGRRGFHGGASLAKILSRHRGKRNLSALPPLKLKTIRSWMQAHHTRTGSWPGQLSGAIPEAPGETWNGIGKALERAKRGLPSGHTLPRLAARMEASSVIGAEVIQPEGRHPILQNSDCCTLSALASAASGLPQSPCERRTPKQKLGPAESRG